MNNVFLGLMLAAAGTVHAADTWTGGASPNNNWSAPGNWLAGSAPNAFDALVFTNQTGSAQTANNDFAAGTPFDGITFGASSVGSTMNLTGNGILLSGATNGITVGVSNATALAETVSLNLTLDWGFHTFNIGGSGSLALNGALTPNTGALAGFPNSGVTSTSFGAADANGLISGLDGLGLIATNTLALLPLATMSGTSVVPLPIGSYTSYASGAIASSATANVELSAAATTAYTDAGITVNTITIDKNTGNTGGSQTVTVTTTGTLTLGSKGGIYVTGTGTGDKQVVKLTGGNLTAGANNVGGIIVLGINGTTTGNQMQLDSTVINNGTGPVTLIKTGPGSMFMDKANTYSGGTYIDQGYLQLNGATEAGTGPIYVASGATVYPNTATTTWANNFFISPGNGANALAAGIGAIKMGNGTSVQILSGTITLLGNPVAAAPGDRISGTANNGSANLTGQITGPGTLNLSAQAATANFVLSNGTAIANNWTGGLIIDDNGGNNGAFVKLGTNNQVVGNNVLLVQSGTGTARFDLNGSSDTIGSLSGAASANNQVANFGATASVLTLGANNGSGTFGGVISGNSGLSLTKIGTGTETLSGANTYTGNTTIQGGTLALSGGGSLSSGTVSVSNATYDVSADGSYTSTCGIGMTNGMFNLGSVVATAVNGLSISNSTLQFILNPSTPTITDSGALVTGGSTNVIILTSVSGFPSYPQQVPLIKYGSFANVDANNTLTNLGVNLPALGNPVGYLTNNTVNSSIDLVLTSGPVPVVPISWNGQTNGLNVSSWDILTTPDWNTTTGGSPYFFQNTSFLTFDDTAAGTTMVSLNTTVLPGGINVANTNKTYTFTGTGKISGPTGLTNNGAGTLILTENGGDNYSGGIVVNSGTTIIDNNSGGVTGGTTINGGILQIGNNDAGGVLPSGTLTDNGALVINRSDTALSLTTVITGNTGTLTNLGSGTVTLSSSPNSPATVVNAGILKLNAAAGGNGCISNSILVNTGGELDLNVNDAIGYNTTLPPLVVSGTVKKLNNQAETLGRVVILAGGTLATTLAGAEQFETQNNYIDTATGTANFINGPGKIGLRASQCYITNEVNSTLTISSVIETNGNAGGNTAQLNKWGTGILILTATNTYTGGTTINGGPLQLGTAGDTAILTQPLGLGPITITVGGTLNFASGKGAVVNGAISDDGSGVVLVSRGTNTLGGVSTYTGQTIVGAGTKLSLANSASISSSALVTVSNATLDLSGGSVISSSGALSLTNSTLVLGTNLISSLGSLSASNGTLIFPVNQNSLNINLTGAYAIGDGSNMISLTAVPGYPAFPTNITLIKYGSFANVDGGNNLTNLGLKLPTLGSPTGYLTNNAGNSSIDLVLLSDSLVPIYPITWTGRTNGLNGVNAGNWDMLISSNWVLTSDGVTGYKYQDTSAVTFDDTAPGTTSVNLTATLTPGSLTVSNASKSYTFSGTGSIAGIEGIVKLDTGSALFAETGGDSFSGGVTVGGGALTLSNANANISGGLTVNAGALTNQSSGTIAGGLVLNGGLAVLDQLGTVTGNTTINAGTLQIGNNDANGSLPTGSLTDGDTLIFDRSDAALSISTVITGGGQVINNGPGAVTINGTDTFTGPTTVNAGVLHLNGPNAAASTISVSSGLTINNGGTVMLDSDNSMGNPAVGGLPVTINAGGVLTGNPAANSGGGTSSHIRGLLTLNGGTLAMGGAQNQTHGSWNLDNGVDTLASSVTATIIASNVVPSHAGSTTFDVLAGTTPNGIDLLVSGTLNNASALADTGFTKTDTGVMVLDNNNTYAHGTTLSGGTLQLGMPGDAAVLTSALGTGTVTINAAGCVLKFGSSAGATVTNVISDDNLADSLVLVTGGSNTLSAVNTYTSPTVISNGTLIVNGPLASSNVTTLAHGTLGGNGTLSGGVTNNGTLMPGSLNAVGALATSADVLDLAGSTTLFKLNKTASPSNDVLNVTGSLTFAGTLKVLNLGGTYNVGDTFKVANAGSLSGAFSATNLPAIGGGLGLTWNPATATLTVVQTVNVNPTNLTASVSGSTLTLTWPADHTGWRLQVQTNALVAGLNPASNAWSTVPGSTSVNTENLPMNPATGAVFYRMVYP